MGQSVNGDGAHGLVFVFLSEIQPREPPLHVSLRVPRLKWGRETSDWVKRPPAMYFRSMELVSLASLLGVAVVERVPSARRARIGVSGDGRKLA